MTALLTLTDATRRFQGLVAVDHVNFSVALGTIHAVIGPNGAGKTTLFNLISGLFSPSEGTISLGGVELGNLPTYGRAKLGIARTFQNIRMFGEMSVLENVMTGMHPRLTAGLPGILGRLPGFRREEGAARERAMEQLAFVGLADLATERAHALSYGDQRRLEIARALAGQPRLLLLDEPAAGMNPAETKDLGALVRRIRDTGVTVMLVEHDMGFVMDLCDRITVLNFGRLIAEGTPREVRGDLKVIEAYLGAKVAAKLALDAGGAA